MVWFRLAGMEVEEPHVSMERDNKDKCIKLWMGEELSGPIWLVLRIWRRVVWGTHYKIGWEIGVKIRFLDYPIEKLIFVG